MFRKKKEKPQKWRRDNLYEAAVKAVERKKYLDHVRLLKAPGLEKEHTERLRKAEFDYESAMDSLDSAVWTIYFQGWD